MHGAESGDAGRAIGPWTIYSGGRRKLASHQDWEAAALVALVARYKRVPIRLLLHKTRCRAREATARHLAMYLMHITLGRTLAEIGRFFGRDGTTVSYACARIEDRRDRRRFDAGVARLEQEIAAQILGGEPQLVALEDRRHAA